MQVFIAVCALGLIYASARVLPCYLNAGFIGWQTWTRLTPNLACTLDLSKHPEITADEINGRICSFTNLTSLNLSSDNLTSLPAAMVCLTHLKYLTLDNNHLQSLPPEIASLTSLLYLSLQSNNLRSIPGLTSLIHLQSLNLADNELSTLPGIQKLPGLRHLNLRSNALSPAKQAAIQAELPQVPVVFQQQGSSSSWDSGPIDESSSQSQGTSYPSSNAPGQSAGSAGNSSAQLTSSNGSAGSQQLGNSSAGNNSAAGNSSGNSVAAASSDSSSDISSSAAVSSDTSSVAASSSSSQGDPNIGCPTDFQIQSYNFCLPPNWHASLQTDGASFTDVNTGTVVATIRCPIQQTVYQDLIIDKRSRTYTKNGETYGVDEWDGAMADGSNPLLLIFMHHHDFNSWYGDQYKDVGDSCQMQSNQPATDQDVFRSLYLSIY